MYKSKPCRHWMRGYCELGPLCDFAHPANVPQREAPLPSATGATDNGPTTCNIHKFNTSKAKWWKFVETPRLLSHATLLFKLLEDYRKNVLPKSVHQDLVLQCVADWIFLTNKIEGTGPPTAGDTLAILQNRVESHARQQHVLNLYDLIVRLRDPSTSLSGRMWKSDEELEVYHRAMLEGTSDTYEGHIGKFRTEGVYTPHDGQQHIYLHHSMIPSALRRLGLVLCRHASVVDNMPDSPKKLLHQFAHAAFAAYHLSDIHPFVDGNGRVARFVAKYFLDTCLPLPLPMFKDRETYKDLILGDTQGLVAPAPLLEMLLSSAIVLYKRVTEGYRSWTPVIAITSLNSVDFARQLASLEVEQNDAEMLMKSFESLEGGDPPVTIEIRGTTYCIETP